MVSMINLFVATGHSNYARCLGFHLQLMLNLKGSHPLVCTTRCTCNKKKRKILAGLWPDLIIKEVLMKYLKSYGGLTHGRALTESVRTLWVNSQHVCSLTYNAMASLTGN